jgi:hypothetical protein
LEKVGELGSDGQWRGHVVVSALCAKALIESIVWLDYGKPDLERFLFLGAIGSNGAG